MIMMMVVMMTMMMGVALNPKPSAHALDKPPMHWAERSMDADGTRLVVVAAHDLCR